VPERSIKKKNCPDENKTILESEIRLKKGEGRGWQHEVIRERGGEGVHVEEFSFRGLTGEGGGRRAKLPSSKQKKISRGEPKELKILQLRGIRQLCSYAKEK